MPSTEGRESPPPETQTGAQLQDPPGSGQGIDRADNKEQNMKDQLANLTSNPRGPLEDHVEDMFTKTEK